MLLNLVAKRCDIRNTSPDGFDAFKVERSKKPFRTKQVQKGFF
ncbi:MAG: hypothetical protein ACRYFV_05620 [Janthinobacterium lividum]